MRGGESLPGTFALSITRKQIAPPNAAAVAVAARSRHAVIAKAMLIATATANPRVSPADCRNVIQISTANTGTAQPTINRDCNRSRSAEIAFRIILLAHAPRKAFAPDYQALPARPPIHTIPSGILPRMLATLKMVTVYIVLGTLAGVIGIPYSIVVGNVRLLYRVVILGIVRMGVQAAGIRVEVTGRENVPAGVSCIFISNHVSNLDPPVILPEIPSMTSVLLKQELMRIPMLGTAMRMGKFVPVERSNSREAAKRSIDAAKAALDSGLHILVFAEGTRSADGHLGQFKKGPFFLAQQTGAPIIPVAISGTEQMMRKGSIAIHPGVARVQMLPPIYPGEFRSRDELMTAVRNAISDALPPQMR